MELHTNSVDVPNGAALTAATITVTDSTGAVAAIFDTTGAAKANPFTSDARTGMYSFKAANDTYTVSIAKTGIEATSYVVTLFDPADDATSTARLAASTGAALIGSIQSGTGAVARTVQEKLRDYITSFDFMTAPEIAAVRAGDYSINVGAALQKAIDASRDQNLPLMVMGGGYLHSGLTFYPGRAIVGGDAKSTIFKLANGSNVDVMKSANAYSYFGTNTSSGDNNWYITGVTLDGNASNQSPANPDTCNGLAYYGCKYTMRDVVIRNVKGHGIRSEWYQYGEDSGGIEAAFVNVTIDTAGRHGWWFRGPHDHHVEALVVIDASAEADNTYCGVYTDQYSNGRFINAHVWHRAAATNRVQFTFSSGGGNELIACHLEGGRGQLEHRGKGDRVIAANIYAHYGSAGTAMVVFANNENIHSACRYTTTTGTDCYALEFKSSASGNRIDGYFGNFDVRSPFLFTLDGGLNTIVGQGYSGVGGAATFGGTQATSTIVQYKQGGTDINTRTAHTSAGTAAAPSHSFDSDPNTGSFNPAADTYAIAVGGNEALRVDSSKRLVKGYTAALPTSSGVIPSSQQIGTNNDSAALMYYNFANDATTVGMTFAKSRGAAGVQAIVQSADVIGGFLFEASDGAQLRRAAMIQVAVDGTPGASDMPGRITFSTTPDGSATVSERLRIDNSGALLHRGAATTIVDANSHLGLRSYTVATLPSASSSARMIYVSDGTTNKRLAVSDGTNWRWPDGAIVS